MSLRSVPVPGLALAALVAFAVAGCVSAGGPQPAGTPGMAAAAAPASAGAPAAPLAAPAASPRPAGAATSSAAPDPSAASSASPAPAVDPAAYAVPGTPPAGALALTTDAGAPFDLTSLRGAPVLVYFGYTHCPDVCPATTGVLAKVLRSAPAPVHVVFVTVDPERDSAPILHAYLSYLPDGFTGLTGTSTAIRAAADGYGVEYERVDTGSASGYAMAHTADVFLVDAAGRLAYRFPFGTDAATIAAALAGSGG